LPRLLLKFDSSGRPHLPRYHYSLLGGSSSFTTISGSSFPGVPTVTRRLRRRRRQTERRPSPTMAAAPTTAPTPMPALAPVLSPEEGGGGFVSLGKADDVPGAGIGVNVGTLNCWATESAYADGNNERSLSSQYMEMESATASPLLRVVMFALVDTSQSSASSF